MPIWIIKYTAMPTAYNRSANARVEADTADDAKALLADRLGEGNGVHNYVIEQPTLYEAPVAKGRILSMGEGQ